MCDLVDTAVPASGGIPISIVFFCRVCVYSKECMVECLLLM